MKRGHAGCGPVNQVQSFLLAAKSQEVGQCCGGDFGARPKEPAENVLASSQGTAPETQKVGIILGESC